MKPTLQQQIEGSLPIVSSLARSGFIASHLILASGSTVLIYMQVISNLPEALPFWARVVAAWVAGAVWFKAVEHPLRKIILFSTAYLVTPKNERKELNLNIQRTGRASVVVTTLLLAATVGLSFAINPDIASAVTTEKDSTAEIANAEKTVGSYDRDVELLRDELAAARGSDKATIAQAEATAARWVAEAKNSKGAKMAQLAKAGNGWAQNQIASAVRRATKKGERHIANAKGSLTAPAALKALNNYMATRAGSRDEVATMTTAIISSRQDEYLSTSRRRNFTLLVVVLVAGLCMVFFARLLVLACAETGERVDHEDGDGIVKVAGRKAKQVNGWLASKLDGAFGDKFQVSTVTASPVMSAPKPAPPTAENSLPRGFHQEKSEFVSAPPSEKSAIANDKVSAPPPPGLAVPPTVSAGFWIDEAVAYRKRVYGWWKTASNPKKPKATRDANRAKAEKAFTWFKAQGCSVAFKDAGKVSIKFPRA